MTDRQLQVACQYQYAVETFILKVHRLNEQARAYFYRLVLHGLACPRCGRFNLLMLREGRFRCQDCGHAGDPTLTFQRCPACDRKPALALRRYHCRNCGGDVTSRFLFDGIVYNADYFREMMTRSRQRRKEHFRLAREQQTVRAWQRSPSAVIEPAINLDQAPGLMDALNALIGGAPAESLTWVREAFDLAAYEQHILGTVGFGENWNLVGIRAYRPPKDKLEQIRIFIACLFLEHAGLVKLIQEHDIIWVRRRESD